MINSRKKGFTLVELVIVIAVVAILAAVLIPTFSNLIKKANISADQQAVVQMNKILAMDEVSDPKPTDTDKVTEILIKNGYSDDLTTYYSNYKLAWILESNVIVLVEDNKVVFPEKYAGATNFEELKPMAKDIEDLLGSLDDGKTVFLAGNVNASNANDFEFTDGKYTLNLNGNTMFTNITDGNYGVKINNQAEMTLENGILEGGDSVSTVIGVWGDSSLNLNNMIITGGFETTNDKRAISVYVYNGSTLTITDSKIYGGAGSNTIQNYGGNLVLNNVTTVQSGEATLGYYNAAIQIVNEYNELTQAHTEINGGSYIGDKAIQISMPGGNVTINNGTFTGATYAINNDFGGGYVTTQKYIDAGFESKVIINGGVFNGNICFTHGIGEAAGPLFEVNGGTFNCDKLIIGKTTFTGDNLLAEFAKYVKSGVTVTVNGEKVVGTR